jgi:hypothetical protein
MSKPSDKSKILQYLMQGYSLTIFDAQRLFNTISLRERVKEIRQDGVNVVTEKIKNPETGRFHSRYYIKGLLDPGC